MTKEFPKSETRDAVLSAPPVVESEGSRKMIFIIVAIIFMAAALGIGKNMLQSELDNFMKKDAAFYGKQKETSDSNNVINDIYLNKIDRAEDVKRKLNLADLRMALEAYNSVNGNYPKTNGMVKLNDESTSVYKILVRYASAGNLKDPKDPEYFYLYKSDGNSFELSARLENNKDPDCKISENGYCIYTVKSSNAN